MNATVLWLRYHSAITAEVVLISYFQTHFLQKCDPQKAETVTILETEAKAPRKVNFKFPKAQATYFSYLISKYGDNYEVSFFHLNKL